MTQDDAEKQIPADEDTLEGHTDALRAALDNFQQETRELRLSKKGPLTELPIVAELTLKVRISIWERNNPGATNYFLHQKRREIGLALWERAPKGIVVAMQVDEFGPIKERDVLDTLHDITILDTDQDMGLVMDGEEETHDVYLFHARLFDLSDWIGHMEALQAIEAIQQWVKATKTA